MLALMRAGGQDPEVDQLFERGRRAGAEFVLDLFGLTTTPPPLRIAMRGVMGMLDEATIDWLTHGCDVPKTNSKSSSIRRRWPSCRPCDPPIRHRPNDRRTR